MFLWEQLSPNRAGHMVFLGIKNRHPTLVWRTPLQITPFLDWSIKTGVGLDWMFLYE